MELCSLTDAARQNIAQTYIGLAKQLSGSKIIQNSHFSGVVSIRPFSFCNFLLGFSGDDSQCQPIVAELDQWASLQPATRVFVMSGDEPSGLTRALSEAGFSPQSRLLQMVWYPARTLGKVEWTLAETPATRREVATFMVQQFFSLNEPEFRDSVVEATELGPHELWRHSEAEKTVSAAMLVRSTGAIGIYNVCVEASMRRRGYGSALMRSAQIHAFERGLPLLLQCDEGVSEWYRELGFQVFGEMQSFQRRFR